MRIFLCPPEMAKERQNRLLSCQTCFKSAQNAEFGTKTGLLPERVDQSTYLMTVRL